MKIAFFYFDGCPNHAPALDVLRAFLRQVKDESPIEMIRIDDERQASLHRFVGSPTIRFEGQDVFPSDDTDYRLACRVYPTDTGVSGMPSLSMLQEAYARASI
jgi:hypothetical protein